MKLSLNIYIFCAENRHKSVCVTHMYLGSGPVVVQAGEAGEVLLGKGGSRLGGNQAVGVGWVPHHQDLRESKGRAEV